MPGQDANIYVPGAEATRLSSSGEHGIYTRLPFQVSSVGEAVVYPGDPPPTGGNGQSGDGAGNEYLARRASGVVGRRPVSNRLMDWQLWTGDIRLSRVTSVWEFSLLRIGENPWQQMRRRNTKTSTRTPPPVGPAVNTIRSLRSRHPIVPPENFGTVTAEGIFEGRIQELLYAGANTGTGAVPVSSHLLFDANDALFEGNGEFEEELPGRDVKREVTEGKNGHYLYDSVGGRPYLVNVLPDGKPEANASFGSFPTELEDPTGLSHVISADGSRIFWGALESVETEGRLQSRPKALYVRENDTSSDARTVQVDAAAPRALGRSGGGRFWTASSDGSKVFFTDCSQLTEGSTAVSGGGCEHDEEGTPVLTGSDLYEYEVNPEAGKPGVLRDLTVDERTAKKTGDPLGADVQGVVGVSENGSYVYFVAAGVLADNENSKKEKATTQSCEAEINRKAEYGLQPVCSP